MAVALTSYIFLIELHKLQAPYTCVILALHLRALLERIVEVLYVTTLVFGK